MKIYSNGKMLEVPSCTSQDIYSTEEQVVGRWIDGKPLYKRTIIKNTTVPTQDTQTVLLDTSTYQIDTIIKYELYGTGLFNTSLGAGYYYDDGNLYLVQLGNTVYYSQHFTQGNVGKNYTLYYTIYYTKTTDQATIELPAALTADPEQTIFAAAPQSAATVTLDAGIRNEEV